MAESRGVAIEQQVADLEERLERIEHRLGIRRARIEEAPLNAGPAPSVATAVTHVTPWEQVKQPEIVRVVEPGAPPAPAIEAGLPQERVDDLEELARRKLAAAAAARTQADVARVASPPPTPEAPPIAPPREPSVPIVYGPGRGAKRRGVDDFGLERVVGGRLAAIAGCLFLAIGLVLGLKYGIDHKWFSFPPAMRCWGVGMLGLAIVGVGEYVRRKLGEAGSLAASAISGAGLAAMYGAVLGAYGMYHLIGTPAAFVLLAW